MDANIVMGKRLLAVLLIVLFSTASRANEPMVITLVYGHENQALERIFNEFGEQSGYKIESRSIDSVALKAELLQRASTHDLPDVVLVPADFLGLSELHFSQLDKAIVNPQTADKFVRTTTVDGRLLGVPVIAGNHLLLYYNPRIIKHPAGNWAALKKQRALLGAPIKLIGWSYNEMYWFVPFLTAFGGVPVVGHQAQLDSAAMQQALAYYWQLSHSGLVDSQCDYLCSKNDFIKGRLAYFISGFWSYAELRQSMGDGVAVAPLPKIEGYPMRSYFSTSALAFPGGSLDGPKHDALLALARFLQSEHVQQHLWTDIKALPVSDASLKRALKNGNGNIKVVIDELNRSLPMPSNFVMAVVWEAMSKGFRRYGAGILNPQQATKLMQHLAEKSIKYHSQLQEQ